VFAPRKQEADAKDFLDNDHVIARMFQKDWVRVARQDRFFGYVRRESKKAAEKTGDEGGGEDTEKAFRELEALLVSFYRAIAGAFTYYGSLGSGSLGGLQLNEYTEFLENCRIPDANSKAIKRSDCDTLFITADFVEDKGSAEAEHMEGGALLRFEFLEVIVRIAVAKYGEAPDAAAAATHGKGITGYMRRLIVENIIANLPPVAAEMSDDFRRNRLYFDSVDQAFAPHMPLLKMVYKRYLWRADTGRRPKLMKLEHWSKIMDDCHMINAEFTTRESKLCYLRAKMVTVDEIGSAVCNESITFTEFLEALARLAEYNWYPSDDELREMRYANRLDFVKAVEGTPVATGSSALAVMRGPSGAPHPPARDSRDFEHPKKRPLAEKITQTLDVMFRWLDWDKETRTDYSADHLMKHLKEIDKAIDRG
jgi:hypothetical protein